MEDEDQVFVFITFNMSRLLSGDTGKEVKYQSLKSKESVWTELINVHHAQRKIVRSFSLSDYKGQDARCLVFCPVLLPGAARTALQGGECRSLSSVSEADSIFQQSYPRKLFSKCFSTFKVQLQKSKRIGMTMVKNQKQSH